MKNRLFRLLPCLLAAAFSGCGLPTVTYLYPPKNMSVDNASISVQNDSRNFEPSEGGSQTFKGIEIFYRIYQDNLTASNMLLTLENLSQGYDESPDQFIEVVTGISYRFMRLRNSIDKVEPLISMNATDETTYYIYLNGDSNWVLADSPIEIIRTITTTSDTKFYVKEFKTGDDDYSGTTSDSTSDFYIVFFAVSYGQDQTTVGQNVYSMPYIPSSFATY